MALPRPLPHHRHLGYERVTLLAVGINTYEISTGLAPLPDAEDDARAMANVFEERGAKVSTLLGNAATADEIKRALRQAAAGPRDMLVVYFSGHFVADEGTAGAI
jgi:hypothetical protein